VGKNCFFPFPQKVFEEKLESVGKGKKIDRDWNNNGWKV